MVAFNISQEPRDYQLEACQYAREKGNCVVCLPTGTGKTLVGILFLKHLFEEGKADNALVLEPTRFLVSQVAGAYEKDGGRRPTVVTGLSPPEDRRSRWGDKVVVSTPQCAFNDRHLWEFDAVVIDECHHTTGLHAYAQLMRAKSFRYRLGLSATIPLVRRAEIESQIGEIREWPYSHPKIREFIPDCQGEVYEAEFDAKEGDFDPESHGVERALWEKLEKERKDLRGSQLRGLISNAMRWYCRDSASALHQSITKRDKNGKLSLTGKVLSPILPDVERALDYRSEHKLEALERALRDHEFKKAVVFTDRVSLAELIVQKFPELRPVKLIGIRKSSQGERNEALERAKGESRLIIGTSAAEEGIDLPTADLLVIWSNVSSETRFVQRFGRLMRKSRMPVKSAVFITTPETYDHDSFCRGLRKFREHLSRQQGVDVDILNMDIPWESSTAAGLFAELKERGTLTIEDCLKGNDGDEKEVEQGFKYLLWSGLGSYFVSLERSIFYERGRYYVDVLSLPSKRVRVYYHADKADAVKENFPEDFSYDSEVKLDIYYRTSSREEPAYMPWRPMKEALNKLASMVRDNKLIYELRAARDWPGMVNLSYYYIHSEKVLLRCLENAYSIATRLKYN